MLSVLNEETTIILKAPIVFQDIQFEYPNEEISSYFKLYLLKKRNKFIVYSPTYYLCDDNFTSSLQAYDRVHHPISLNLHKEFENEEAARLFYAEVMKSCPQPFDYMALFSSEDKSYGFDSGKSVHYDFHKGRIRHDDFYHKELVRHGYQKVMVRIFRFGSRLVINTQLGPQFATEEKCIEVFFRLKEYFDSFELKAIPYEGDENKLHQMLERLVTISLQSDNQSLEIKRDEVGRFNKLNVNFSLNGYTISLKYALTTRNGNYHGYDTDSTLAFSTPNSDRRFFEMYRYERSFMKDLQKVIDFF